jgi:hypothetical protein
MDRNTKRPSALPVTPLSSVSMRSNSPTRMGDKRINKFGFSLSINSTMWLLQKITASGRSVNISYSFAVSLQ